MSPSYIGDTTRPTTSPSKEKKFQRLAPASSAAWQVTGMATGFKLQAKLATLHQCVNGMMPTHTLPLIDQSLNCNVTSSCEALNVADLRAVGHARPKPTRRATVSQHWLRGDNYSPTPRATGRERTNIMPPLSHSSSAFRLKVSLRLTQRPIIVPIAPENCMHALLSPAAAGALANGLRRRRVSVSFLYAQAHSLSAVCYHL